MKHKDTYPRLAKGTAALAFLFLIALLFPVECPIRTWFQLPCPGCHMTTALYWLIQGDLEAAYYFHPGVFIFIPYLAVTVFLYVKRPEDWWKCRMFLWLTMCMLICLLVIYGFRLSGIWKLAY